MNFGWKPDRRRRRRCLYVCVCARDAFVDDKRVSSPRPPSYIKHNIIRIFYMNKYTRANIALRRSVEKIFQSRLMAIRVFFCLHSCCCHFCSGLTPEITAICATRVLRQTSHVECRYGTRRRACGGVRDRSLIDLHGQTAGTEKILSSLDHAYEDLSMFRRHTLDMTVRASNTGTDLNSIVIYYINPFHKLRRRCMIVLRLWY